jgi:hypothetical protein
MQSRITVNEGASGIASSIGNCRQITAIVGQLDITQSTCKGKA